MDLKPTTMPTTHEGLTYLYEGLSELNDHCASLGVIIDYLVSKDAKADVQTVLDARRNMYKINQRAESLKTSVRKIQQQASHRGGSSSKHEPLYDEMIEIELNE